MEDDELREMEEALQVDWSQGREVRSKKVSVVGGGLAGLVAIRELCREGHEVVAYERGSKLDGTWVYTPETESDPLGIDPTKTVVHSSLYDSLRTNLPRHIMVVFQVVIVIGASASAIDITRDIAGVAKEVRVVVRRSEGGIIFWDKLRLSNMYFHPMNWGLPYPLAGPDKAYADGRVGFQDGTEVIADVILHCTGYKYHYPFLHTDGAVNVDDNRVGPLYKHVFPPALAPGIAFVGIPNFVITSVLFELQSKWIAGVLSERISLPSEETMMLDVEAFYSKLEASNVPKRHTHRLNDFKFELEDWLAKECGCPPIAEWRKNMFHSSLTSFIAQPETYRNELDCSEVLYEQAEQEFRQYLVPERVIDRRQ
ncbi:hypothetical protein RND81_06G231700 [Saponaria officinalis]|uniref:Flavin-containing monooxygenase n=1 Tax=Saponaria officinalis TaxID=3572 RepID=A0AAW1KFR3_SAPOF